MRHSVRARFLPTLACASCAVLLPGPALAAGGSPLHIDPASPVAKEYALPLATARGAPPESGQSGKLFGSGIKRASTTTSHTTSALPTTTPTTRPPTTSPSVPPATTPAEPPSTDASTSSTSTSTQVPAPTPGHRRHPPEHVTTVTLPALTTPTTQTTAAPATARATPAAYRVLRPGSGSGLLWMALAAVVVVAVGSAGGIALSRRR